MAILNASGHEAANANVNRQPVLDTDRPRRVVIEGAGLPEQQFTNGGKQVAEAGATIDFENSRAAICVRVESRSDVPPLSADVDKLAPIVADTVFQARKLVKSYLERAYFVGRRRYIVPTYENTFSEEVGVGASERKNHAHACGLLRNW